MVQCGRCVIWNFEDQRKNAGRVEWRANHFPRARPPAGGRQFGSPGRTRPGQNIERHARYAVTTFYASPGLARNLHINFKADLHPFRILG